MQHDNISPTFPITNCVVDSNVFVSKEASQTVATFRTIDNGISNFGTFDYNFYCRPIDDNFDIHLEYVNGTYKYEFLTLENWRLNYNNDQHSGKSPGIIEEYKVNSVKSSNYITNGTFENSTNGWNCWSNYNNCKVSIFTDEGVTGNALKATFLTASGKTDGYMVFWYNSFSLSADKTYRISFAARSNKANSSLQIIPKKDNPYSQVADSKYFLLNTIYNQYEYVFNPNITDSKVIINFQYLEGQGDLWIDNIEFVEVDATKHSLDDFILFEYNATKIDKTIALNDSYIDVKGIPVSTSVTLKPFTSIILFKNLNLYPVNIIKVEETSPDFLIKLYPNPVNEIFNLELSDKSVTSCQLYSSIGQVLKTLKLGKGLNTFDISNLKSGVYFIKIITQNDILIRILIKN